MTEQEFADLKPGDTVQNYGSGQGYTVIDVRDGPAGRCAIAVRTVEISHLDEWKVTGKHYWTQREGRP